MAHNSATRGRRTSMDYLGKTLGNATLAMHAFADNTAPAEARDELHGIIDGTCIHLAPFVSLEAHPACHASSAAATFSMVTSQSLYRCPATTIAAPAPRTVPISHCDEGGSKCKDCAIVQELADRHLNVAINQTKPDVGKMCDCLTKYEAHQLRGKLHGIRRQQLRRHLEPDTPHMILDFKMR